MFMELKNELHEHTNTHSSKQIGFIKKSTKLSAQTLRGVKCPQKAELTAVYILTSIDLYILFGSCP